MGALMVLVYAVGGVLALVIGAVLCFAGYLYYVRSKFSHLPSPKLPRSLIGFFVGHVAHVINRRKVTKNDEDPCLELYIEWYNELGNPPPPAFVIFMLHVPVVILSDTENIKDVIMQVKNSKPTRFKNQGSWLFGERFSGNGLVSISDYETWKPKRKIYDPPFNRSYLKTLLPSFNECCDKLLDGIRSQADGKTTVYMKQHLAEVTLNVISKAVFYVFVFRHKALLESPDGLKFSRQLNFERVISSCLNPLKVCLPTVVEVFASITNHHEIVFCYSILEQNKRLVLSSVTPTTTSEEKTQLQKQEAVNILDCFFPFDPYHLKRSSEFIQPLYQEWEEVELMEMDDDHSSSLPGGTSLSAVPTSLDSSLSHSYSMSTMSPH